MSTGNAVGGVIGAVAGFFIGGGPVGAFKGFMYGFQIGGMLDPPKGPHMEGPRLDDLSVQTSTYGANIPRVYGTIALYGNVFWLENNSLKEVATDTESGGKGGSTSTSTTYSYYATFAVGLCEGPIGGVLRIWVGSKLIYDAGSSDINSIVASNGYSELFTLYTGTDTQMPDSRMQATLGVANTPAYRGLAYLVFNDLPLADHGNSLLGAQIKVEVAKVLSVSAPAVISKVTCSDHRYLLSMYYNSAAYFSDDGMYHLFKLQADGSGSNVPVAYMQSDMSGKTITEKIGLDSFYVFRQCWADIPLYATLNASGTLLTVRNKEFGLEVLASGVFIADGGWLNHYLQRGSDKIYVSVSSAISYVYDVSDNFPSVIFTSRDTDATGVIRNAFIGVNYNYSFNDGLVFSGTYNYFVCYDKSWNILWSLPVSNINVSINVSNNTVVIRERADQQCVLLHSGPMLGFNEFYEVSQSGLVQLSSVTGGMVVDGYTTGGHHLVGNLWLTYTAETNQITVIDLYPKTSSGQTLSQIVSSECLASNMLTAGDIDATALTQTVRGYRVSSISAIRSAIEPLQSAWPFDVIQHGYAIKFKPRGGSSVVTIPSVDLDARGNGDSPGVSITNSREMDSVLPAKVSIKYLDVSREYDTGEQYAERLNTDAVNILSMDMSIVLTAGEAAQKAEVLLYLYWLERRDIVFQLPPTYNQLEPGDVITVNADEAIYSLRLTAITYTQDGRLECTAKYNSAALYTPAALGEEGQSTGSVVTLAGAPRFELLDIPLLLDSTDLAGFPVAMTGYLSGWPGGVLVRSDDAGQSWAALQAFVAPGATIGYASNSIGAGRLDLFDNASSLAVITSDELSSVTELSLFSGANHFAYGVDGRWEIVGAKTCTLQVDGSYVLTDLLRGRQGSEWACGLHADGDKIVLLDSARLKFLTANLNSIGQGRIYRGVTIGKTIDSASDHAFTYTGVNLECLAPCYLNGDRQPTTNDWTLTWIRRTRVGGAWRDLVDATLGESTEAYEVEIYSSAAYTTLKRTITGLSTATCAYTSAQQVTDFGSNQATLYVKVYQLSANVGRGYPLTTSITR